MLFSNKIKEKKYLNSLFNAKTIEKSAKQKHLGLILDEKLTFKDNIKSKFATINKLTSTLGKVIIIYQLTLLLQIYKSFIRPHLDYADVIFDKPSNAAFSNRIK